MNRIALMVFRNIVKVPGLWVKLCHYAKNTERYPEEEKYFFIQHILKLGLNSGNINLQVFGKENIPETDGMLLYGNHQGLFDVVAVVTNFDRKLAGVIKKEAKDVPFIKQVIQCTKSFPMDRDDARQSLQVIQEVTKEVQAGRNYIIFPEGTRSRNGNEMLPFHGGSFRAAIKAKCPVLPVAVVDTHKVFDNKGSAQITCQLHYLPPIYYEEYQDMKAAELAELVRGRIEETVKKYSE